MVRFEDVLGMGIAGQDLKSLGPGRLLELLARRFGEIVPLANHEELVPLKLFGIIDGGPAARRTTRSTASALAFTTARPTAPPPMLAPRSETRSAPWPFR